MCMQCLWTPEEGIRSFRSGVVDTGVFELLWVLVGAPLGEPSVSDLEAEMMQNFTFPTPTSPFISSVAVFMLIGFEPLENTLQGCFTHIQVHLHS